MGFFDFLRIKQFADTPGSALAPTARARPRGASAMPSYSGLPDDFEHNSEAAAARWLGSPGDPGVGMKMYRSDAHIRASLHYLANPIVNAIWDFTPASDDPIDHEVADFCRYAFFENLPFENFLKQLVINTCRDGFSLYEVTDNVQRIPASRFPNHPGKGQGVAITGLHNRPSWSVYEFNSTAGHPDQLKNIVQQVPGNDHEKAGFVTIPAKRLLRWTYEPECEGAFWGSSILRPIYGIYKVKRSLQVLQMIKSERMAIPTPMLGLPEEATAEDIEVAEAILRDMRSNEKGYIITPHGYNFSFEGVDRNSGTPIQEAIEACNRDIAINVMAGFTLLGLQTQSGSFALAQTQEGQFQIAVETLSRFVASTFNARQDGWNVVERLVQMNYGDRPAPKLAFRNLPTKDWSSVLPVINNLASQSNIITPDNELEKFVRDVLSLPKMDEATARTPAPIEGAAIDEEEQ